MASLLVCWALPTTTWSTCSGSTPERASAPFAASAPSSTALSPARSPRKGVMGVRAPARNQIPDAGATAFLREFMARERVSRHRRYPSPLEEPGAPASPPGGGLHTGTAHRWGAESRDAKEEEARGRLGTPTSGRHRCAKRSESRPADHREGRATAGTPVFTPAPRAAGPRNRVSLRRKNRGDSLERRPPAGTARERETRTADAAPCQGECRIPIQFRMAARLIRSACANPLPQAPGPTDPRIYHPIGVGGKMLREDRTHGGICRKRPDASPPEHPRVDADLQVHYTYCRKRADSPGVLFPPGYRQRSSILET